MIVAVIFQRIHWNGCYSTVDDDEYADDMEDDCGVVIASLS